MAAYSFVHYVAPVFEVPEAQAVTPTYSLDELERKVEVDESATEMGEPDPQSEASLDYATSVPASGYADGTYTGSAYGFRSTITVEVVIEGGKISSIAVLSHGDDESFFSQARAVISEVVSAQSTNVDTVSGATYSSRGILAAVKDALSKAARAAGTSMPADDADSRGGKKKSGKRDKSRSTRDADEKPPKVNVVDSDDGMLVDGVYQGSAEGFRSTIVVEVTVKKGKIAKVSVVSHDDDPAYFSRAAVLAETVVREQTTDVDVVSGATWSSYGILNAVADALKGAVKASDDDVSGDGDDASKPGSSSGSKDSDEAGGANSGSDDANPGSDDDDPCYDPADVETFSARAWCVDDEDDEFDYELSVEISVVDGKVVGIAAEGTDGDYAYNTRYIDRALNGVGTIRGIIAQVKRGALASDIDVVTGATYSSNAIRSAYALAYEAARDAGALA